MKVFHHHLYARIIEDTVNSLEHMDQAVLRVWGEEHPAHIRLTHLLKEQGEFHQLSKELESQYDEEEPSYYQKYRSHI